MGRAIRSALFWLYVVAVFILGMLAGFYVDFNARDLELSLAGIGALVAVVSGVWWWRAPKRLRWLPGGVFWIGLFASIVFAIFHGWAGVVQVVFFLCSLAFVVVLVWFQRRLLRATFPVPPELAIEASQPLSPDAQDETNAIRVYPSNRRLVRALVIMAATLASCGGLGVYAYAHPDWKDATQVLVLTIAVCALTLLAMLISIRQLIRPQPLFTLSDAGIHIRKMTLVRWREIVGMYIMGQGIAKSWASRRTLVLRVANPGAVIGRQPRRWRWALRLGNSMFGSPVAITEQQLPMSLEAVEALIVPYLKRAHRDAWGNDDGPDVPDPDADPAQD